MRVQDIKEVIKNTIEDKENYKAILIDGVWGCGKTTIVKDAIKELSEEIISKKKLVYQSLFGIKDVTELAACFSYAGKIIYSLGKSIASPFTKLIPIVGDQIKESIDNSTALFAPSPSKKKDTIFIFDDFERVDELFSYITLLGFFNQLIMRGCKIICVSSLKDLSKMDIERKKGLDAFLEKAFDRVFYINDYPEEIITNIFSDNDKTKQCIKQCVDMFEGNIRIALKAKRLITDIYGKSDKYKYDLSRKYTDLQIMKSAICATKAIYFFRQKNKNDDKNKKDKEDLNYLELLAEHNPEGLDYNIAKNIDETIKEKTFYYLPEETDSIKELAKCICMVEIHNDYSMLVNSYPLNVKKEQKSIYDVSVFYFDDKGKQDYFRKFKEDTLNGKLAINRAYIDRLVEIIKYTNSDIKEEGLLDYIISKIINDYSSGNKEAFNRLEDFVSFPSEVDNKKIISTIFSDISSQLNKAEIDYIKSEMDNSFKTGDYAYLVDLLYDVEHYKKPERIRTTVKQLLIDNRFYMPDLSQKLEYESWTYCHQVARLSKSDDELRAPFIELLKEETKKHKNSVSAVDRAKALVQYNFDANEFGDFVTFCNELN